MQQPRFIKLWCYCLIGIHNCGITFSWIRVQDFSYKATVWASIWDYWIKYLRSMHSQTVQTENATESLLVNHTVGSHFLIPKKNHSRSALKWIVSLISLMWTRHRDSSATGYRPNSSQTLTYPNLADPGGPLNLCSVESLLFQIDSHVGHCLNRVNQPRRNILQQAHCAPECATRRVLLT